MDRSLVVEFCGLPGSGKSSLAAQTCLALRSAGVEARVADHAVSAAVPRRTRVRRRGSSAVAGLATRPLEAARAARLVAATRPSPRDGAALLAQLLTVQRLTSAARHRGGVVLVEEGTVQTMWSLALRAGADTLEEVRREVSAGCTADLLVVVEAPTALLLHRLEARSSRHSRTQRLDPGDRGPELERGRRLLDQLLVGLPQATLTVGNDGSTPLVALGQHTAGWVLRAV
jgi:RecA/RadA recombinase